MQRRLLAFLLTLALLVSYLPLGAAAEETATAEKHTAYAEPLAQHAHAASGDAHICEHCVAAGKTGAAATPAWQAWSSTNTTLPQNPGHYYLTGDLTVTSGTLDNEEVIICLNGYTVTAKSGHRFYTLKNSAKLTILDCTAKTVTPENEDDTGYRAGKLTGATNCGFMYEYNSANASEIHWYDGILTNVSRGDIGGAFCVQGASKLCIYGGEFSKCTSTKDGGLVYLGSNKCSMLAENATFLGNQAAKGGIVYSKSGATTLKDCTFIGNKVTSHGAAYAGTGGSLVATGCTFTKHTAANFGVICGEGGGIKVTLDSCRITDNSVANDNGVVFVPNSGCQLNLKGSTYIYGNTRKGGLQGNIHLQNDANGNYSVVTVDGLTEGAKIGIGAASARTAKTKVLSKALSGSLTRAQVITYFYSDDPTQMIDLVDDKLTLAEGHVHTAHLTTCTDTGCTGHDNILYLPWTKPSELPTEGNWYLDVDVTTKIQPKLTTGKLNLCLNGKTITFVHRFDISGDAVLNITDCTAKTESGVYSAGKLTGSTGTVFYMTGDASKKSYVNFYEGIITGNHRTNFHASVAYIQSGATMNMYGGEISGNSVTATYTEDKGGTVYLNNSTGTFNMYGGKIANNTVNKNTSNGKGGHGGAIYSNGGTVNILGGEISGNTAAGQGGAIWAKGGKVTVKNAAITGNTAGLSSAIFGAGGGVQIILDNAQITGNKASSYGTVYIPNGGAKIIVSGDTKITNNEGGNVYLVKDTNATNPNHPMITLGEAGLGENAKIGITMPQNRLDTEPNATLALGGKLTEAQAAKYFYSDNSDYEAVLKADRVKLEKSADAHSHCICGVTGCTEHEQIACKPWTDTDSLPTEGSWYLENDVTTKVKTSLSTGTVNLCLNGKTITLTHRFEIYGDAVLNITDCNGNVGKIVGSSATVFYMFGDSAKKSYVNFYQGIITECNRPTFHASVAYIQNNSTLNMYGGEITGNTVGSNGTDDRGGTIYVHDSKGTFNMYGGKITGNTAVKAGGKGGNGGAIFSNGGIVNILGGEITGNTAEGYGGAIYAKGGKVTVKNAKITGNTAPNTGAIFGAGGGVQITLDSAQITDNTATGNYGAVYIPNSGAKIIVSGATKIENNQGGDVFLVKDSNATNPSHPMISLGAEGLAAGAHIGITMPQARLSAEPYASNALGGKLTDIQVKEFFFCTTDGYEVALDNDRLLVQPEGGYHVHCVCGSADCAEHPQIQYKAWTDPNSLPTEGNWYLFTDVTISKEITVKKDLNLCLNGHKVTGTTSANRFYSTNGTANEVLTISDCTAKTEDGVYTAGGFYSNTYTNTGVAGGAFFARPNSTLNFYDGIIEGCSAYAGGGAIYGNKGSTINIYNGKFTGNTAKQGDTWKNGGVIYLLDASLTVYGGSFTGNEGANGSVIYSSGKSAVDIRGGSFTGNTCHGSGAILAPTGGSLAFSGAPVIVGNTNASGAAANVYLGSCKMDVADLDEKAQIAVTAPAFIAISNKTQDYSDNFLSDDPMVYVVYQDEVLYTLSNSDHKHCLCAATSAKGCDHSTMTFHPWTNPNTLPSSGNYYLDVDVTVSAHTPLQNTTLNLCLNGHTVTVGKQGGRVFRMNGNCTLNITDCAGDGKLTGATQGVLLSDGGASDMELNLYNGTLTGNHGKATGGALVIQGGIVFNMYGGKITENSASSYLTLDADGNPKLDANGNQIPVAIHAGGVYVGAGAAFNMYGGEISNNKAIPVEYLKAGATAPSLSSNQGGGLYVTGCVANLYGGKICDNEASLGGGIYVRGTGGILNLEGVEISGNKASSGGGIISQTGGQINLKSGVIKNNYTTSDGAGIYVSSNTSFNMTGGEITGNNGNNGGGIFFLSCEAQMTGGKITGNTARNNGGGFGTSGECKMTMSNMDISKNTAKNGGGILLQGKSVLEMSSGKITGNKASAQGGGGFISTNTTFTMTGGEFSGNTSTGNGGGLSLLRTKAFTMKGGSISYNTGAHGGGINISGGKVILSGGSIVGNRAIGTLNKETGKYTGGNGGGIIIGRAVYKENGVNKNEFTNMTVYYTYIAYNKSNAAAGGILVQSDGTRFQMYGGTVAHNESANSDGGGAYFSTKTRPTVQNVTFYGNKAKNSGAFHINGTTGTFSNIKCYNNESTSSGAVFVATGKDTLVDMKNMEFYDNTAKGAAGAFVVQSYATVNLDGAKIYSNSSGSTAGAIYFSAPGYATMKNIEVYENKSNNDAGAIYIGNGSEVTIEDSTIRDNASEGMYGGAIGSRGRLDLKNVKILNNRVAENGGGLAAYRVASRFTGQNAGIYAENCVISGNQAGKQGGGVYNHRGGPIYLDNCTITDNTAVGEGGGVYSDGRFGLTNATVTGNTSGGEGYAVYITASEFDGHSYSSGHKKFAGNMIIKDNQGGDLYLSEGSTVAITGGPLGEKSHMEVTLHSGVLTNSLFGVYDYEGSDLVYTVTAGQRSLTEPEVVADEQQQEKEDQKTEAKTGDVLLYAGIGVVAVAAIAGLILIITKKKKSPAGENK